MTTNPLATYLHDHLAGSHFAVELLATLHDRHKNDELGPFAARLRADIQHDQQILQSIIEDSGDKAHFDLKDVAAWIAEKVSQIKLRYDQPAGLGTFEALEALSLGITGKVALWTVLPVIGKTNPCVPPRDYQQLAERARANSGAAWKRSACVLRGLHFYVDWQGTCSLQRVRPPHSH